MTDSSRGLPQDPIRRYSNWAVTFHWVTAVLVLAQAYFGFAFSWSSEGRHGPSCSRGTRLWAC
jgi:cytochrome b561